jgi:hypothetical protein
LNQIQFEDNGRAFKCERGPSPATPGTMWWWVNISGESQRYAAFRAEKTDTEKKVKSKVIAYYEQLLIDRARPPMPRQNFAQRKPAGDAAAAAAQPAEVKQA